MMREMVSEDVAAAVTRDTEGEAHSFAANLLMPKRRVLGMVPTHASVSQILAAETLFQDFLQWLWLAGPMSWADCLNGNIGRFAQN